MKNLYSKGFKGLLTVGFIFIISSTNLSAQTSDSLYKLEREFKNTIRFNITNPLIFGGQSIIFGYERVLKNNHSFSINIGQASLPDFNFMDGTQLKAKSILSEGGFHISGDYRFYLSKLNKYNAPRGVYIGPYYSYNTFDKKHSWEFTKDPNEPQTVQTVDSDLRINIHTVGFEMGYQFVFWKHFSVDMILLGPGVGVYNMKADVGGNLSDADRQLFFDQLNEVLKDKFPGYSNTLGSNSGEFEKKGTKSATSLGYRYMIQIGYRF
ncbi:MAG: hypothetical protein K2X95_12630 [Flavobacteriaceae bacterium]|nr:hypothetical protein [Flavobacteriaceae bacterium]